MENPDLITLIKFFTTKYENALQSGNLDDFNDVNLVLNKMIPQLEELSSSVDKQKLSSIYETLSEFIYNFCVILTKNQESTIDIKPRLKWLAEKAIALDEDSFWGIYYLSLFHTFSIIPLGSEGGVGLVDKGISAISKTNFSRNSEMALEKYKIKMAEHPVSAKRFLTMTEAMMNLAEICHGIFISNRIRKDIHKFIGEFEIKSLDFSEYEDKVLDEVKERAMALIISVNANL